MLQKLAWIAGIVVVALFALAFLAPAFSTWKPEYANAPQAVQDWYKNAEITKAARPRFNFAKCCEHADVVKTKFHVNRSNGTDEWFWLDRGNWRRIPDDIIHWGEIAPGGEPTLFVYNGVETCFWPGASGN